MYQEKVGAHAFSVVGGASGWVQVPVGGPGASCASLGLGLSGGVDTPGRDAHLCGHVCGVPGG